mgnify:CR=1 FL=1
MEEEIKLYYKKLTSKYLLKTFETEKYDKIVTVPGICFPSVLKEIEEKHEIDIRNLKDKYAEEDKKKEEEKKKERQKSNEDALKQADDLAEQNLLNQQKRTDDAYLKSIADEIERNNAKIELEKQRATEKEARDYEKKIADINKLQIDEFEKNSLIQQTTQAHQLILTDIEKQAHDARQKNDEAAFNAKVALYKQTGDALGALSDVVGKQTGAGKALALAQIAIDTGIAISGIVRQASTNPLNFTPVAFALDIAMRSIAVLANIKKAKDLIASAKVPGGGGGGSLSLPPATATAPIAPQMSSTAMNQQMINQMGNAATRAFVLESDVSGNQERIRRLNRAARIN